MKGWGIVVIVSGLGLVAAGAVFFVKIALRASEARVVKTVPLSAGAPVAVDVDVSRDRKCQVSLSVQPDVVAYGGTTDHRKLRSEHPFTVEVRVLDDVGKELAAGTMRSRHCAMSTNGMTGVVEFFYSTAKFDPPGSGRLRVEAGLANESATRRLRASELRVYDNVTEHTAAAITGGGLAAAGSLALLSGGGMLLWAILNKPAKRAP